MARFRYAAVADNIATLIERGLLQPGDRLPSVRRVAERQHVSLSTVVQAYWMLEDRGLVETRTRSGHYVRHRPTSQTERLPLCATEGRGCNAEIVSRLLKAALDPSAVNLASAYPSHELLPLQKLNALLASFAREASNTSATFDVPAGRFELRLQIARRLLELGLAVSPEEIVITMGTAEAIHLCLAAATWPGDLVAVESPASFVITQRLEMLGLKALELPANHEAMLHKLQKVHRQTPVKACVIMPSFSNPTGSCIPDEARGELVSFLNEHDIPLVEDDACGDVYFDAKRPLPLKAFDTKGLVMLCSSFSKTLAPGYRVGWAIPGRFQQRVEQLKFATSGASPVLPQLAVAEFLRRGGYRRHLESLRCQLPAQLQAVARTVLATFPAGTHVTSPRGGTVLWVQLPDGADALMLERMALDAGIGIAPGPVFSVTGRDFGNFVRLGYGHPFTPKVEAAIRQLGALVNTTAPRCVPCAA